MDKHLSSQYEDELAGVTRQVLEMGGVVEQQISLAVQALSKFDLDVAAQVVVLDERVNQLEVEIDQSASRIIARRQPAATDLRFLVGVSKITSNLERAGDEASRIARMVQDIVREGQHRRMPISELNLAAELASTMLHRVLDAFARLDANEAVEIIREDDKIDVEFDGFVRKLVTFMMEDPRMISSGLDLLFVAKALERIGDHCKNLAEIVIYVVKGSDVRHLPKSALGTVVT